MTYGRECMLSMPLETLYSSHTMRIRSVVNCSNPGVPNALNQVPRLSTKVTGSTVSLFIFQRIRIQNLEIDLGHKIGDTHGLQLLLERCIYLSKGWSQNIGFFPSHLRINGQLSHIYKSNLIFSIPHLGQILKFVCIRHLTWLSQGYPWGKDQSAENMIMICFLSR